MGRPLNDQMGEPMGPRSSDDQQRCRPSCCSPVLDRPPLLGIEGFEVGGCGLS